MPVLTLTNTSSGRASTAALEHPHLLDIVHDDREPALRDLRQLGFREKALEQQDAPRVALFAQLDRRIELDQRQAVGVLQRRQHARRGRDHRRWP